MLKVGNIELLDEEAARRSAIGYAGSIFSELSVPRQIVTTVRHAHIESWSSAYTRETKASRAKAVRRDQANMVVAQERDPNGRLVEGWAEECVRTGRRGEVGVQRVLTSTDYILGRGDRAIVFQEWNICVVSASA